MDEIWYTITKYPDYEVSINGQVRNKLSKKIKKFTDNGHGYLRANFLMNHEQSTVYLHRIIAETFIDNPNNLPEINHKDGDKYNNEISNLEWCTSSFNQMHRHYVLRHGNCKCVQCVETSIVYESTMEAERETKCDHRHISECCRGIRRTCGGYHWIYVDENINNTK